MRHAAILLIATAAIATTAHTQVPAIPPAEQIAIIVTALDYAEGYYSGAPERMERALHPDLNKVYVQKLAQTGRFVVGYSTYSGLIEMTRARLGLLAPERSKVQASALAMVGDVALAKVNTAMFNDFLTMIKVDGAWKIVNVLWVPGPDTPNRPTPPAGDAVSERDGVARAVGALVLGIQTSDAARTSTTRDYSDHAIPDTASRP